MPPGCSSAISWQRIGSNSPTTWHSWKRICETLRVSWRRPSRTHPPNCAMPWEAWTRADLTNRVQRTADWLRRGVNPNSNGTEEGISKGLEQLSQQVHQAQQGLGHGQTLTRPAGTGRADGGARPCRTLPRSGRVVDRAWTKSSGPPDNRGRRSGWPGNAARTRQLGGRTASPGKMTVPIRAQETRSRRMA